MAVKKYLSWIAGVLTLESTINVSTGPSDGNKIISTNGTGKIDPTLLPDGIGGGVIDITYVDLAALKTAGTLSKGSWYFITDRYIWIQALDIDKISMRGHYLAHNPDFQNVTTFFKGVWVDTDTYNNQDLVAWNGVMYTPNVSSTSGGDAPDNSAFFNLVPLTDPAYQLEIDACEFDFDLDWLQFRQDKRGNEVRYEKIADDNGQGIGQSTIRFFQWGNNLIHDNYIDNAVVDILNIKAIAFNNNTFETGCFLGSVQTSTFFSFISNKVQNFTQLVSGSYINGGYSKCIFNGYQDMSGATLLRNTFLNDCELLRPFAKLKIDTSAAGGQVQRIKIDANALPPLIDISSNNTVNLNDISCASGSYLELVGNNVNFEVQKLTIGFGSSFGDNFVWNSSNLVRSVVLGDSCVIRGVQFGFQSTLSEITLEDAASIDGLIMDNNKSFQMVQLGKNTEFSNLTVNDNVFNWKFGTGFALDNYTVSAVGNINTTNVLVEDGFSNFEYKILAGDVVSGAAGGANAIVLPTDYANVIGIISHSFTFAAVSEIRNNSARFKQRFLSKSAIANSNFQPISIGTLGGNLTISDILVNDSLSAIAGANGGGFYIEIQRVYQNQILITKQNA